jgi:hypothetical protein
MILIQDNKMKRCVVALVLLSSVVVLTGCSYLFCFLPADCLCCVCAIVKGAVIDSSTRESISGVRVSAFHGERVMYADSTDSAGAYQSAGIEYCRMCGCCKLRKRESEPPPSKDLDLRIVFEKPGYKTSELVVWVEFVRCSRHPQPAEVPETEMPDVLLVQE